VCVCVCVCVCAVSHRCQSQNLASVYLLSCQLKWRQYMLLFYWIIPSGSGGKLNDLFFVWDCDSQILFALTGVRDLTNKWSANNFFRFAGSCHICLQMCPQTAIMPIMRTTCLAAERPRAWTWVSSQSHTCPHHFFSPVYVFCVRKIQIVLLCQPSQTSLNCQSNHEPRLQTHTQPQQWSHASYQYISLLWYVAISYYPQAREGFDLLNS